MFFPVWNQGQHQKAMGFHSFFRCFFYVSWSVSPGIRIFFEHFQVKIQSPERLTIESCSWTLGAMLREPVSEVDAAVGVARFSKTRGRCFKNHGKMWMSWENMGKVLLFTMFLPMFWQKSIHQHMKSIFWDFMGGWPSRNLNVVMESHHF